jgi:hypothetical protein
MSATARRRPHRLTAWGLKRNPLPTEAIGRDDFPFSEEAFEAELADFADKIVAAGLSSRRSISFVYSHHPQGGEDTGFGKTATMLQMRNDINRDLGAAVLDGLVDDDERVPIGAAYASFNTTERTGYYQVLVAATHDAATAGEIPLLKRARERIVMAHGTSPADIRAALNDSQIKLNVPLRPETVDAFCYVGAEGVAADIATKSETLKLRSGLQWLHFLLVVLDAAGIRRLFLFVDQLEDLATNKAQSRAKRFREIGRIRDLLEDEPTRSMLHTTFTMHDTAAYELEEFWVAHRLPSYELRRANMGQIVLLEGLRSDPDAAKVLGAWLSTEREDGYTGEDYAPFQMSAVRALRALAEARVGLFLVAAAKVLDAAEASRLDEIDDGFVDEILNEEAAVYAGEEDEPAVIEADDDLL